MKRKCAMTRAGKNKRLPSVRKISEVTFAVEFYILYRLHTHTEHKALIAENYLPNDCKISAHRFIRSVSLQLTLFYTASAQAHIAQMDAMK